MPNARQPQVNPDRSADRGDQQTAVANQKGRENILSSEYEDREKRSKSEPVQTPGQAGAQVVRGDGQEQQRDRADQRNAQGNLGEAADRGKDSLTDQADVEQARDGEQQRQQERNDDKGQGEDVRLEGKLFSGEKPEDRRKTERGKEDFLPNNPREQEKQESQKNSGF